ncbi:MAG: tRNA (5-methylaminomethyl-2-thiouridine)(34)-methyltransferase MnmD [Candidatus Sericytochromatia bacterium]
MRQIIKTKDNSDTIFDDFINESFHSVNGAISESIHVFIEAGFKEIIKTKDKNLNILEIGFGTGLNTILTFEENIKNTNLIVNYDSIELYPLEIDIYNNLSYKNINTDIFSKIHQLDWNKEFNLSNNFIFKKININLLDFDTLKKYDLVYFDAFSPDKQPELWTTNVFEKIKSFMTDKNSILVTYCAKGYVKRNLKEVGFILETLKGPVGKREMIRVRNNILTNLS